MADMESSARPGSGARLRFWPTTPTLGRRRPATSMHFYGTHSVDIDGELAQLDIDGNWRPR